MVGRAMQVGFRDARWGSRFGQFKEDRMRIRLFGRLLGILVVLTLALVLSCGGQTINPRFQPEISNVPDNFQFQVTAMTNVSQTLTYNWENSGTVANVNQACSITKGSATLAIRDPQDTLVYARNLAENGSFVTNAGVTGTWRIVVTLSGASGTINFRVQKRP